MKGATRTTTVKIRKLSGKRSKRNQTYPILILAIHKKAKLISSLSKTKTRE